MVVLKLKNSSFESGKIAVKRGKLLSKSDLNKLSSFSFDEILKFLEEHGFRKSIDSSYLNYEGFYLIERVLNSYLSDIYSSVFSVSSKDNKKFLELYYLKYQIHNLISLIRCYESEETDLEPFLIGDKRKKEKFLKASKMPNIEDGIVYIVKKIGFDANKSLEVYKNGLYFLEDFLYREYYNKLLSVKFDSNLPEAKKIILFNRELVDLINARSFIKLVLNSDSQVEFRDIYIQGGSLGFNYFDQMKSLSAREVMDKFKSTFKNFEDCKDNDFKCAVSLDKLIEDLKKSKAEIFKNSKFGTLFYVLRYLSEVEGQVSKIRTLLKAKYLKLTSEEVKELVQNG